MVNETTDQGPLIHTRISPDLDKKFPYFFFLAFTAMVGEQTRATLREMEDQTALMTQLRREMSTTRELITRIRLTTASVNSLGPFLNPYQNSHENDLGGGNLASDAVRNLGEPSTDMTETSFFGTGRMSSGRSETDLIRLGSVRSNRNRCTLPVGNTFFNQ